MERKRGYVMAHRYNNLIDIKRVNHSPKIPTHFTKERHNLTILRYTFRDNILPKKDSCLDIIIEQ